MATNPGIEPVVSVELLPCPLCGSGNVDTDCMSRTADGTCNEPAVVCNGCHTIFVLDFEAAKPWDEIARRWNTRPSQPPEWNPDTLIAYKDGSWRLERGDTDTAIACSYADYSHCVSLAALASQPPVTDVERVVDAAKQIIERMSSTFRARNGKQVGIEGDDGEKCWIVHSDDIAEMEAAIAAMQSNGEG